MLMRITFGSPGFLLLLLLLPLAVWIAHNPTARAGRLRRLTAIGLRLLLLTLLILSLARPQLEQHSHRLAILILIDRSHSLTGATTTKVLAQIDRLLATQHPETQVGIILFGNEPLLAVPPRKQLTLTQVKAARPTSKARCG